jgi:polysaccharide biosynthesis/export protein
MMRATKWCLAALLMLAQALCLQAQTPEEPGTHAAPPSQPTAPLEEGYEPNDSLSTAITGAPVFLGAGDLLEISVFDVPELSVKVRVSSDGEIALPLIGKIKVEGMNSLDLQDQIAQNLIKGRYVRKPQVTVYVSGFAGQVAYVTGEVNRPGAYPLLRSHKLFDLIAVAGGPSARAGNEVTITRSTDKPETIQANLNGKEDAQNNLEINPGDRITVGRAGIVYVLGEVGRPGGFLIDRRGTITVLQALALAQGLQTYASMTKAVLFRNNGGGRVEIDVNIKKILKGQEPDFTVRDDDILYIYGSAIRGLGRNALTTVLATASAAAIYAVVVY